jgi:hypothetical protein
MLQFYNDVFIREIQDLVNVKDNPIPLYSTIQQNQLQFIENPSHSISHLSNNFSRRSALES